MGILTVRKQELQEAFLGIALKQQCSRSIYYVVIYHTHICLALEDFFFFFIELGTDEALYIAR